MQKSRLARLLAILFILIAIGCGWVAYYYGPKELSGSEFVVYVVTVVCLLVGALLGLAKYTTYYRDYPSEEPMIEWILGSLGVAILLRLYLFYNPQHWEKAADKLLLLQSLANQVVKFFGFYFEDEPDDEVARLRHDNYEMRKTISKQNRDLQRQNALLETLFKANPNHGLLKAWDDEKKAKKAK